MALKEPEALSSREANIRNMKNKYKKGCKPELFETEHQPAWLYVDSYDTDGRISVADHPDDRFHGRQPLVGHLRQCHAAVCLWHHRLDNSEHPPVQHHTPPSAA